MPYLILSHTWGPEEVTFSDMADLDLARKKKGFAKISGICEIARSRNIHRAWVDTCCIDKSSSAELTEAINSMFRFYQRAQCCIAYLEDLQPGNDLATEKDLQLCRWFTRGWTLQELIAPLDVQFFDNDWSYRGSKDKLIDALHAITGIHRIALRTGDMYRSLSVAARMSWAANRETTRVEDRAYSLMGLFDINMPLLYGERGNAFIRLQETIAQESNDMSLFAWRDPQLTTVGGNTRRISGLFAPSPSSFRDSGSIVPINDPILTPPSFTMSNAVVGLTTSLAWSLSARRLRHLHLHCTPNSDSWNETAHSVVVIALLQERDGIFVRAEPDNLRVLEQSDLHFTDMMKIRIRKKVEWRHSQQMLPTGETVGVGFNMNILLRLPGLTTRYSLYPKHLRRPGWGKIFCSSQGPNVCIAEINFYAQPSESPAGACFVFCSLRKREKQDEKPAPNDSQLSADVALIPGDALSLDRAPLLNGSEFTQLDSGDLCNPYTLSNLGLHLATLPREIWVAQGRECSIQCGPNRLWLRVDVEERYLPHIRPEPEKDISVFVAEAILENENPI